MRCCAKWTLSTSNPETASRRLPRYVTPLLSNSRPLKTPSFKVATEGGLLSTEHSDGTLPRPCKVPTLGSLSVTPRSNASDCSPSAAHPPLPSIVTLAIAVSATAVATAAAASLLLATRGTATCGDHRRTGDSSIRALAGGCKAATEGNSLRGGAPQGAAIWPPALARAERTGSNSMPPLRKRLVAESRGWVGGCLLRRRPLQLLPPLAKPQARPQGFTSAASVEIRPDSCLSDAGHTWRSETAPSTDPEAILLRKGRLRACASIARV
mmetsp:Transcript_88247/g.257940  ORF Transcript_88247/g.257940 Transcript_88247/m.257940 type:complete len:268 (+) Transcript_88247:2552-3355(+)